MAQKYGIFTLNPFLFELPYSGRRKPDCRSRWIGAAKNGSHGMRGSLSVSQNEAFWP
jgi:hypothetical protein